MCVLTWSETQRKRISKWKDQFGCLPRLWESLQEKLPAGKVLRLGITFRRGSTSNSLTCTALLRLLSRLLPSVLSQELSLKSPLQMPTSIFLINWLPVVKKNQTNHKQNKKCNACYFDPNQWFISFCVLTIFKTLAIAQSTVPLYLTSSLHELSLDILLHTEKPQTQEANH